MNAVVLFTTLIALNINTALAPIQVCGALDFGDDLSGRKHLR